MQDIVHIYIAVVIKKDFEEHKICSISWPLYFPGLNLIEDTWSAVQVST